MELIRQLPSSVYHTGDELDKKVRHITSERQAFVGSAISRSQASHPHLVSSPVVDKTDSGLLWDTQSLCTICLDNFITGETTIRALQCGHIFHQECIDTFLGNHSSLCPQCKASVLPYGYCPTKITNTMVRRERHISRLRSSVTARDGNNANVHASLSYRQRLTKFVHTLESKDFPSPGDGNSIALQQQPVYMTSAVLAHETSLLKEDWSPTQSSPTLTRYEVVQRRIQEVCHLFAATI